MSAYIILHVAIHDKKQYLEYVSLDASFVAKHKGVCLVRGSKVEVEECNRIPERLIVHEFPSNEHAKAFLQDPDYQPIRALRQAATTSNLLILDGFAA